MHYDDDGKTPTRPPVLLRLIDDDKVDVHWHHHRPTMSMVLLVERAGLLFISLAGAVVIIEPVKKMVFKNPAPTAWPPKKSLRHEKRGLSRWRWLSETRAWPVGQKETEAVGRQYGVSLVANETYTQRHRHEPAADQDQEHPGVQALFILVGQARPSPPRTTSNWADRSCTTPGVASEEFIAGRPGGRRRCDCRRRLCW